MRVLAGESPASTRGIRAQPKYCIRNWTQHTNEIEEKRHLPLYSLPTPVFRIFCGDITLYERGQKRLVGVGVGEGERKGMNAMPIASGVQSPVWVFTFLLIRLRYLLAIGI